MEITPWFMERAPGAITAQIVKRLFEADFVIAEVTQANPNVMMELGMRYALRRNGTILVANRANRLPFDIGGQRVIIYDQDDPSLAVEPLILALTASGMSTATHTSLSPTDSPVFSALPEYADMLDLMPGYPPFQGTSGACALSGDWTQLRRHPRVTEWLHASRCGDRWYLMCISMEGFPWNSEIEQALLRGVAVNVVYLDFEAMLTLGPMGRAYVESMCTSGVDASLKSIQVYAETVEALRAKLPEDVRARLRVFTSVYPHSSLSFLCEQVRDGVKAGWGLMYPYRPFAGRPPLPLPSLGLLFRSPGSLFDSQLNSTLAYFLRVEQGKLHPRKP